MSEENIGDVTFTEQERNELIEQIANLEQDKENVVNELKSERTLKQEAQKELEAKKDVPVTPADATDPIKLMEGVLQKRDEDSAATQRAEALEDFKNSHVEFNSESDAAGIVFAKFEKELNRFNTSGIKSKAEMSKLLSEAYDFMNRNATKHEESAQYHKGSKPSSGSVPEGSNNGNLTDAETRLMLEIGWTKDRFVAAKAKRPAYIASLLKYRA